MSVFTCHYASMEDKTVASNREVGAAAACAEGHLNSICVTRLMTSDNA